MTRLPLSVEAKLNLGSTGERHLEARIKQMGLPKPEREYLFAPGRRFRADFWWGPPFMLIVEVNGAVWASGRHTRGSGYVKDLEKLNIAQKIGYTVLQYTTEQVEDDTAINELVGWFNDR